MANQDLINEIFDVEAIKKQVSEIDALLDATKKGMSDYAKQIKEASGNFDTMKMSEVMKENEKAVKKTTESLSELDKLEKQRIQTVAKLEFATSEEGKAMLAQVEAVKTALKEQNNSIKVSAQEEKAIRDVTNALTKQVTSIASATAANNALRKAAKNLDITTEDGRKTLEKYNRVIDANDKFIAANSDAYSKQKLNIGNYKSAIEGVEKGTLSLRAAQKIIRDEMAALAVVTDNGRKGTDEQRAAYQNLTTEYGKFTDKINDANAAVKGASEDFVGLTASLTAFKAGITVFQGVQSAMAMFGVENENVLKTMQQLQATQALLNSINEVATLLRQKDVFLAQLQILTESKSIVVKKVATAAQWALNAARSADPTTLIIMALIALTTVLVACSKTMGENTKVTKAQAAAYADVSTAVFDAKNKMTTLTNEMVLLKNAGADSNTVMSATNNVLKEYGVTTGKTAEESEKYLKITQDATKSTKAGRDAYLAAQSGADSLRKSIFDLQEKKRMGIELSDDEEKQLADNKEALGIYNKRMRETQGEYVAYNVAIGKVNKAIEDDTKAKEDAAVKTQEAAEKAKEAAKAAAEERKALMAATNEYMYQSERFAILNSVEGEEEKAEAIAELDKRTTEKTIQELERRIAKDKMAKSERVALQAELLKQKETLLNQEAEIERNAAEKTKKNEEQRAADIKSQRELVYEQDKLYILLNIKDEEERNQRLKELDQEQTDNRVTELKKQLENEKLSVQERAELEKELVGIQQASANEQIEIEKKKQEDAKTLEQKQADFKKDMVDKIKELALQSIDLLFEAVQQSLDAEMQSIDKQREQLEESTKKKQELLDGAVMSDETRKEQQAKLDEEAAAKKSELDKKERDTKIKAAKWEKAQAMVSVGISTAKAAMEATAGAAQAGLGFPAVLVAYLALLGGVAAAQIALIASQKIPEYEKGTDNHPGGWAKVSEHGQLEVIETPDKKTILTDKPTYVNMPKHSKVYPNMEAYAAAKNGGSVSATRFDDSRIVKAVENSKAVQSVNIDKRGLFEIVNSQLQREIYIQNSIKL